MTILLLIKRISRAHCSAICFIPFAVHAGRRYKSNGATSEEVVSPRTGGLGHPIEDEYAAIRENYSMPIDLLAGSHFNPY